MCTIHPAGSGRAACSGALGPLEAAATCAAAAGLRHRCVVLAGQGWLPALVPKHGSSKEALGPQLAPQQCLCRGNAWSCHTALGMCHPALALAHRLSMGPSLRTSTPHFSVLERSTLGVPHSALPLLAAVLLLLALAAGALPWWSDAAVPRLLSWLGGGRAVAGAAKASVPAPPAGGRGRRVATRAGGR